MPLKLLYFIVVPAFYLWLAYSYYQGIRPQQSRRWWIAGGVVGFLIGTVWAGVPLMHVWKSDFIGAGVVYAMTGIPWSLPILVYGLDFDSFRTAALYQLLLTVISATAVFGNLFGCLAQQGWHEKRKAAYIVLGVVLLAALTLHSY